MIGAGCTFAGRYRIEGVLGQGGMGTVYRATQLALGRPVALKVLRRDLLDSPQARMRFEREARVASAFQHPASVTIHELGEHEGSAYLVMELAEGQTMRARLEEHPGGCPVADAIAWLATLADAVAAAHAIGLVHRDLKPENVLFEPSGNQRILDFGLAFLREDQASGRMTKEGVVVGTPEYLSPEQARGQDIDGATDVYAMGCILHELIVGAPPFVGIEVDVVTKQMFAPPPPLARDGEPLKVPAALDDLRRAMLDKRADRRPSAAEVRDRLNAMDPDPDRGRARAREDGYLGARARRMVDAPTSNDAQVQADLEVAIAGALPPEVLLGLRANAIHAFTLSDEQTPGPDTLVIVAPYAQAAEVRALVGLGRPVIAAADRGDVTTLSELMRAGAADVTLRPIQAAELTRKIRRVAKGRAGRR